MITPPDEQVESMIAEAKVLGKPQITDHGWMTFEFWIKSQKIIQSNVLTFTKLGLVERSAIRR